MREAFAKYITDISNKYAHPETSEMGYRTEFETLLKQVFAALKIDRIDHDAKAVHGNKPDFVVIKKTPLLYVEVKNVGVSLDKVEKSEQMARYYGYTNLVLTDYVEFRFYRNGIRHGIPISIGKADKTLRTIMPIPNNFDSLDKALLSFTQSKKEPIKSGNHLARIMGGSAQRIRDEAKLILNREPKEETELFRVYESFKKLLVHDLTPDTFADMYAQTMVYGLFVARYNDMTPKEFTRSEAKDLIPRSNPLLKHFFEHIAGSNFEESLEIIVNELCEVFSHANISDLMQEYFKEDIWGKTHKAPDPIIHFYEDFLKEYDEELRKKMGAYYTPLPVVQFIVRAVDRLLEKNFNIPNGLADTQKLPTGEHRIQILDPAVGTGTFISDVIGKIYARILKRKQEGTWPSYVHHDLLPRLHGFELMMAPYTIAHLKLSIAFKKTGFKYFNDRLGIYLTNSLEQSTPQTDLFANFGFPGRIADESKAADAIKTKRPIMVVVGNPPYSVSSSNKNPWIQDLIKDYKAGLGERKINLDDDYIKFIRLAEHYIERNQTGIVAMITNNSFIDGITHRQMRKHLLETFDDIYILDLHGSSKKKEKAPDGGKDENVFNIQQGVSVNIFVRKNKDKKSLGTVHHAEIYGKRAEKYKTLNESKIENINWKTVISSEPYRFFLPRNTEAENEYQRGFKINEIMSLYNSGIQTKNDVLAIQFNAADLNRILQDFLSYSPDELSMKYHLENTSGWNVKKSKESLKTEYKQITILYRPFDLRKSILQKQSGGFIGRSRYDTSRHFLNDNLGLITVKQQSAFNFQHILATNYMIESGAISLQTKEWGYIFPLYLYADNGTRHPNLKRILIDKIENIVGNTTPEDIFDYIYAVLHSPKYRAKYKEFLKIDFPRVPYPKSKDEFWKLVPLGTKLRELHLMTSSGCNELITTYPVTGDNLVEKIKYENGKVYINSTQYFGDVPEVAWNFYIGGYQPAQKWLKDRKGRVLTNEELEHYQKIIAVLEQTNKIMNKIDHVL